MENTQTGKQSRSDGVVLVIFFSIFVLALTLLIVVIRLLQQRPGGFAATALLVFAIFGIIGSLFAIISSATKPVVSADLVTASLETATYLENSRATEHLEQLVQMHKQQNQSLEEHMKAQEQQILILRGQIKALENTTSDWEGRSIEVFRMIERVLQSGAEVDEGYRLAMLRTKNHFTQLVSPMGIQLLEPKSGDAFDDKVHQIVNETGDISKPPWTIVDCVEWGYVVNGYVEIPAKVVISHRQ